MSHQDMLFGSTSAAVDDAVAQTEARLCALNAHNPSPQRAQQLLDWLIASQSNLIVLTELRHGAATRRIITSLQADGFAVTCPQTEQPERYTTLLAAKGYTITEVIPVAPDPRIVVVDAASAGGNLRLAGAYGPTNGMTADSSTTRAALQKTILHHLESIAGPRLCVTGDLNTIEPGHQPALPAYLDHDYAFYTGLLNLGTIDAYRQRHPDGTDHSWLSDRFGNQRLDHTMISADLVSQLTDCRYDHSPRSQGISDHAAMLTTLRW